MLFEEFLFESAEFVADSTAEPSASMLTPLGVGEGVGVAETAGSAVATGVGVEVASTAGEGEGAGVGEGVKTAVGDGAAAGAGVMAEYPMKTPSARTSRIIAIFWKSINSTP